MQPGVFRALEFDRVRDVLAQAALTPLGRHRLLVLEPEVSPERVRATLALTTEAVGFVSAAGSLAMAAPDDLETLLVTLDVADQPLEPLGLLAVARFVESVMQVAGAVDRGGAGRGEGRGITLRHRGGDL